MQKRWTVRLLLAGILGGATAIGADTPTVAVSGFAPVKDLREQLDQYIQQLERDLSDEAQYNDDVRSRVEKDANTVIVLAQALGAYDEPIPEKQQALALVTAARELVDSASDFATAREALDKVKEARQATGEPTAWEPVADLPLLMKQVPVVNNSLRLGVNSRRFERSAERSAGHATTLAAIAHASSLDMSYCAGEEDEKLWREICIQMRDASAEVRKAIDAKDQAKAQEALAKVVETCDACHHRFRD